MFEELNFPHPKFSAMEIEELSDPEDVWTPGGRKNSPSPNPKAEKKAAEVKKKPKKPKTKPKKEVRVTFHSVPPTEKTQILDTIHTKPFTYIHTQS